MYENKRLGFLFVLPFVLGILLFKLFPFVASFALSFTQYDLIDPPEWVGLQNYRELFGDDPLFRKSLGVTLWFAVLAVPLRVGFALFIAHVLNFKLRGINFFRSAFYLPSILGGSIATAVLWRFLFAKYGLVNLLLMKLGFEPIAWLADEHWSMWTIVFLFTWQFGSAMVIFLAALQNVPQSLYEAAEIDGAGSWQRFKNVTMVYLRPAMLPYAIYGFVITFNLFALAYFMSAGGPQGRTELLVTQAYRLVNDQRLYGVGASFAVIMFFILLGITLVTNRMAKATRSYHDL